MSETNDMTTGSMVVSGGAGAAPALPDVSPAAAANAGMWPADWREQVTGGDAKALKTVNRFSDPAALWNSYRELRERVDGGRMVRLPGAGASDADRAAFHRALGVPEKPEDYFDLIALPDGEVLGEADRPVAESFARAVHEAGATPEVMSAALRWYFDAQENERTAVDVADEADRTSGAEAIARLWGPAEKRMINAIGALFAAAPGGTASEGEGVFARLMSGRTGDGKLIGNDPQVLAFLGALAARLNPIATVTGGGAEAGHDVATRIKEIETMMRNNDTAYWRDDAVQQEYRELLEAGVGRG